MGLSNTGLILEGADDVVGLNKNQDETLLGEVVAASRPARCLPCP